LTTRMDQSMASLNRKDKASNKEGHTLSDREPESWNLFPKTRDESVLSPTDEVAELTSLNTKLSRYIDRVRSLQGENTKLTKYVCSIEESQIKESEQMHVLYREKIETLKKEKEKIARQVSHLGATYKNILTENKELKGNLSTVNKEIEARNERQSALEKEINSFGENSSKAEQETKSMETRTGKIKQDQTLLKEQLKTISSKTEILSEDCQNLCHRLKLNSELLNAKLERVKTDHMTWIAGQDKEGQTKNIVFTFQENMEKDKECDRVGASLISKLHTDISQQIENWNLQEALLNESKSKVKNLEIKIRNLLEEKETVIKRLDSLESVWDGNRMNHLSEVKTKDIEIKSILEKIRKQTEEFENLVQEKQGLNTEIAVFKKLVETEEERLKIKKDDVKLFKKSGPGFTFVEEKERTARRELVLTERQL